MAGDLHSVAVDAEKSLEQLATGLAQAGADEGTVKAVTSMADVTRKIVKALGQGQEQTADTEPPEPQPEPEQPQTMDSATAALHHSAQAAAHAKAAAEGR